MMYMKFRNHENAQFVMNDDMMGIVNITISDWHYKRKPSDTLLDWFYFNALYRLISSHLLAPFLPFVLPLAMVLAAGSIDISSWCVTGALFWNSWTGSVQENSRMRCRLGVPFNVSISSFLEDFLHDICAISSRLISPHTSTRWPLAAVLCLQRRRNSSWYLQMGSGQWAGLKVVDLLHVLC